MMSPHIKSGNTCQQQDDNVHKIAFWQGRKHLVQAKMPIKNSVKDFFNIYLARKLDNFDKIKFLFRPLAQTEQTSDPQLHLTTGG